MATKTAKKTEQDAEKERFSQFLGKQHRGEKRSAATVDTEQLGQFVGSPPPVQPEAEPRQ